VVGQAREIVVAPSDSGPANKDIIEFEWPVTTHPVRPYGLDAQVLGSYEIDVERMRRYRIGRVRDQLAASGASAILCFNSWNTQYITATTTPQWTVPYSGLRYALQIGALDEAILYEQGEIGYHAAASCPWLYKVKVAITGAGWIGRTMGPEHSRIQTQKLVNQVILDMKDAGLSPTEDTLAIDEFDPDVWEAFRAAGLTVIAGAPLMSEARKIKNRDEVECLRVTCAVGDAMFEALRHNLRPGVRESELVGLMHEACYRTGGRIYAGVFLASGPGAWPNPRDESHRLIQPGDTVYADVYNTAFLGYKVCYYRTFSVGKATRGAREDYKKALDWLQRSIDMLKPGVTTKEVAEAWPPGPEIWDDIYIRHEDQTAGSNWGHGCGLTLYEPPIIWRAASLTDPVPLEAGMTFAMETQHGTPGKHGVRVEEMVHLTTDGPELLSYWPVDEITEVD
jgi:Xaa-Pro aminopeptidase